MGGGIQSAARLAQALDLGRGQLAMPAGRQRAEAHRAERDALERLHAVTHGLAHPPHLALAALVDGDLELARADPPHPRRPGAPVVELDPLAQAPQGRLADGRVAYDGAVGLRD